MRRYLKIGKGDGREQRPEKGRNFVVSPKWSEIRIETPWEWDSDKRYQSILASGHVSSSLS
jgi:hypothetical protein